MLPAPITQNRITRAPGVAEPFDPNRDAARSLLGWPTIVCDFSARQGARSVADALRPGRPVAMSTGDGLQAEPGVGRVPVGRRRLRRREIAPVAREINNSGEFPRAL